VAESEGRTFYYKKARPTFSMVCGRLSTEMGLRMVRRRISGDARGIWVLHAQNSALMIDGLTKLNYRDKGTGRHS
jgi:hypothetical protein